MIVRSLLEDGRLRLEVHPPLLSPLARWLPQLPADTPADPSGSVIRVLPVDDAPGPVRPAEERTVQLGKVDAWVDGDRTLLIGPSGVHGTVALDSGEAELRAPVDAEGDAVTWDLFTGATLAMFPLDRDIAGAVQRSIPLALVVMALDGVLGKIDGAILVASAIIYVGALIRISRGESAKMRREFAEEFSAQVLQAKRGLLAGTGYTLLLLAGMALTILGANFLVAGAVSIAVSLGVSDAIIGLTIVAVGTSAPELATTIVATVKDDRDVAVGNLIGSSIYNVLVILGTTLVASPLPVDDEGVHPDSVTASRHSAASVSPISSPGSTPAMNSAAMETVPPAASEYSTALWLGGIRMACTEPLTVTAVAKSRG